MAAYEVLLLNTAVPQIQAAQAGDTYVVPRDIAINATAIISANSATDALRITQTGAGNAILVEDSANPDSSPFVVTAAGNVGIGTTNPGEKLEVQGGFIATYDATNALGAGYSVRFYSNGGTAGAKAEMARVGGVQETGASSNNGALSFATRLSGTVDERARITSGGDLLVGDTNTFSAYAKVHALNGVAMATNSTNGGALIGATTTGTELAYLSMGRQYSLASTGEIALVTTGAKAILFGTSGTEAARITSGGVFNVGLGSASVATNQGIQLNPAEGYVANNATTGSGTSLILLYSSYSVANETKFEVTSEGNVKSRTNSYAGFSDARLKQNITLANTQWDDIKNIEVVKFQMKSEQFSDENNPWMLGVIAQQVETVSPGLVEEDPKDGMKTVKYSILYMKAVKALQEAMARIETLEAEVAALKGA